MEPDFKVGEFIRTQDGERLYCVEIRETGWGSFIEYRGGPIYNMPISGLRKHKNQSSPVGRGE